MILINFTISAVCFTQWYQSASVVEVVMPHFEFVHCLAEFTKQRAKTYDMWILGERNSVTDIGQE